MDSFSLLFALVLVLSVNTFFSFSITSMEAMTALRWRFSSVFLLLGSLLLLLQNRVPPLLSIFISNYLILLGFLLQMRTAMLFEKPREKAGLLFPILLTLFYGAVFFIFTYIHFNTSLRIIGLSLLITVIFIYGTLFFRDQRTRSGRGNINFFGLFIFSGVVYFVRSLLTALGIGSVQFLMERNIVTSFSFLSTIIVCLLFNLSLINGALRRKTDIAMEEKSKLQQLFGFLNNTARYLDMTTLYETIENTLRQSLGVRSAAIFMLDETTGTYKLTYDFNDLDLPRGLLGDIKSGEGLSGAAIEMNRVMETDIDSYPIDRIREAYKKKGVTRLVSAPVKTSEGVTGAISIAYSRRDDTTVLDKDFLYHLGELIGLVLENASLYDKTILLAHTDPLTGLLNRRKMTESLCNEMKRAERGGHPFSVAIADLDDFKEINDRCGHNSGDEVLMNTARIFREVCRETDLICRWGGEEFLFLFIDSPGEKAAGIADRIRQRIKETKSPCECGIGATISVGVTEYEPDLTLEQLINRADEALYRAKSRGKDRIELY